MQPYPLAGDVDGVPVDDAGLAGDVGQGGAYRSGDERDGERDCSDVINQHGSA